MAEEDRPSLDIEPERKLARAFLRRAGLVPPVDVESLIRLKADIEVATFPTTCDCLLIRRPRSRPHLIISSATRAQSNRYRFTLAHELGHLVIPWQGGSMFCHSYYSMKLGDSLAETLEAEANRFASELLVPSEWARNRLVGSSASLAAQVMQMAADAAVSPITAMLTAARVLPPNHLLVIIRDQTVEYVATSPGSLVNAPSQGSVVSSVAAFVDGCVNAGARCLASGYGAATLITAEFAASVRLPIGPDTSKDSALLLRDILADMGIAPDRRKAMLFSTNGIIGSANSSSRQVTSSGLYSVLLQRFMGRPDLTPVVMHPRFKEFLALKAYELVARKNAK